jgi:AhpD family alkylhydroperoxidase
LKGTSHDRLFRSHPRRRHARQPGDLRQSEKSARLRAEPLRHFCHSPTALGTYLALQNAKSSLQPKEREVINLVVSQVNDCEYCLAAHTALGKMVGFTEAQILEIRRGRASFDPKLDGLARFVREVAEQRRQVSAAATDAFLAAGWSQANLVDAIMVVGDKSISNYLHGTTKIPVDFPAAEKIAA